jgi:hypothetical protein
MAGRLGELVTGELGDMDRFRTHRPGVNEKKRICKFANAQICLNFIQMNKG